MNYDTEKQWSKIYIFLDENRSLNTKETIQNKTNNAVKRATNYVQLVLQHCCKPSWIAMLRVLPPMFDPVLQEIRMQGLFSWVVKRATHYSTHFAAMLQNKLRAFCCPFYRALGSLWEHHLMNRWSKVFVNHESGRKSWMIEVKNDRNHEYQDSNDSVSTPENIVNSNTFLFQWNSCLKVTLIRILAMQHSNTQNVIRGGWQFFGHKFLEGAGFLGC